MCGAKAKLIGRKSCLCQNLIINPPYCEKRVGSQRQFLRQRSSVWRGAPSSLPWALCGPGFGSGCCFFWWGLLLCTSGPSVPFHHVSESSFEAEVPAQPVSCQLHIFLRASGIGCGLFLPGVEGRTTCVSHFPPALLSRTCHFRFLAQPLVVSWDATGVR